MNAKDAEKMLRKQIEQLEQATYMFETVIQPRYAADKKILENLRDQHLKLQVLIEKGERGEKITTDEFAAAMPGSLR
jgi:hypothetical protein